MPDSLKKKLTIYGASDDLIEIEGDLREEFYLISDHEPSYLSFSDGTCLSVNYDNEGIWRFNIKFKGTAEVEKIECVEENDDDGYSDIIHITGDIKYVIYGSMSKVE